MSKKILKITGFFALLAFCLWLLAAIPPIAGEDFESCVNQLSEIEIPASLCF